MQSQLSGTKGKDNTNLLHFLARILDQNSPDVFELNGELMPYVSEASKGPLSCAVLFIRERRSRAEQPRSRHSAPCARH